MSKLEDKDPEFYKFLKENDSELLEFDESEDGSDESSGDENTEESSKPSAASFVRQMHLLVKNISVICNCVFSRYLLRSSGSMISI